MCGSRPGFASFALSHLQVRAMAPGLEDAFGSCREEFSLSNEATQPFGRSASQHTYARRPIAMPERVLESTARLCTYCTRVPLREHARVRHAEYPFTARTAATETRGPMRHGRGACGCAVSERSEWRWASGEHVLGETVWGGLFAFWGEGAS